MVLLYFFPHSLVRESTKYMYHILMSGFHLRLYKILYMFSQNLLKLKYIKKICLDFDRDKIKIRMYIFREISDTTGKKSVVANRNICVLALSKIIWTICLTIWQRKNVQNLISRLHR